MGEVPDIRLSAMRMQQATQKYYQDLGVPLSAQASDVAGLSDSLASILAPLYEDVREPLRSTIKARRAASHPIRERWYDTNPV